MEKLENWQPKYTDTQEASRIYFLPNFFTAGNLFFGFLAIIRCIQAKYSAVNQIDSSELLTQAVFFIFLACVCDALDGRLARLGGKESIFGIEFDSMADVVSFGVAPALMVFFQILSPTEGFPFFRQIGWFLGFIYLLCAAIRLARFNVITSPLLAPNEDLVLLDNDFKGLPVPPAAGAVASLVLLTNRFDLQWLSLVLPPLMLLIAWLMVSTIRYPSFKKFGWQTKMGLPSFIAIVILGVFTFLYLEFSITLLFLAYIFYGLMRSLRVHLKKRSVLKIHSIRNE